MSKLKTHVISIKRRIDIRHDNFLKEYLKNNCEYRRKIYNDFVIAVNNFEESNNNILNFSPRNFASEYYNTAEKLNQNYSYYASGIRAAVAEDIHKNIRIVSHDRYKLNRQDIKLKKLDDNPFYMSFSLENKREERRITYSAKSRIFSPYEIFVTFNKKYKMYPIKLKEPILDSMSTPFLDKDGDLWYLDKTKKYIFREKDIKRIIFIIDNGKYYISLVTEVTFLNNKLIRSDTAGIDTGIHNPLVLYDGSLSISYRMPKQTIERIEYLEKRSNRLRQILMMKYDINIEKVKNGELDTIYTNNYLKVREKLLITNRKIHNIRKNWALKVSKEIVTSYDNIVVDTFSQPMNGKGYTEKVKKMNYDNRNHAMYDFNVILRYMANKYYCNYIESPKYTTRMCSKCGHVNKPLPLDKRDLKCEKCCNIIDRDLNAAINCFNYYDNL